MLQKLSSAQHSGFVQVNFTGALGSPLAAKTISVVMGPQIVIPFWPCEGEFGAQFVSAIVSFRVVGLVVRIHPVFVRKLFH